MSLAISWLDVTSKRRVSQRPLYVKFGTNRISSFWSNICISIQMLLSFEMILKIEPKNVKKRFFTNVTHILKLYQTHLLSISSDVVMDN